MNAHILTVGDELLIGQVINTNQAYIARRLNGIGVDVAFMATVGDGLDRLIAALGAAWDAADLTVVTGGLGPTHDDVTRTALVRYFRTDLVTDEGVRARIAELLARRNVPWTAAADNQSLVPRSARVIPNPVGTAPGLLFQTGEKRMIVLPGVPDEMKEIMDRSVIPMLAPLAGPAAIRHRTLLTTGIAESFLAAQLGDLDRLLGGASLAFLPSSAGVRLRITVHAQSSAEADGRVREVETRIRARVARYIYGVDDEEMESVLGGMLASRGLTIAVAESCTGGLIAHRLTGVSGSSAYVERCLVTYSNASKTALLGVDADLIAAHGAVSREVALAMARGVRTTAGTDIGLSTTGIAGPTGGSPDKPVGTVWIGIDDTSGALAMKFLFSGTRLAVKERAAQAAMELVRRRLLKLE